MRCRASIALLFAVSIACVPPAAAAIAPADSALLGRVAATYRNLKRYVFQGSIHVDIQAASGAQSQHAEFMAAVGGGGKLRDVVDNASVGGAFVSDGKQTWVYNAGLKQYVHKPGGADSVLGGMAARGIAGSLILRYAGVAQNVLSAERLPDESVTLEGKPRPCHVIVVTYPQSSNNASVKEGPRTYWIDKQTHLVLRQKTRVEADMPQFGGKMEQVESITYARAALDPVLSDTLWTFKPPPGSEKVMNFSSLTPQESELNGKKAVDFALKDLVGKSHTLAGLKGKVVLLDFWATWCGPCRITMPRIAKIHDEYKTKGVEVLSINVGEPQAKADAYMKKNGYKFTTLLDGDRKVSTDYKVNGIPTLVVIDKEGTISSYLVGAHDEPALREALAKAGVK